MNGTLKTFIFLAGLTAMLMFIGAMIGGESGAIIAFFISLAMNVFSYYNSDKIALRVYKAKPIEQHQHPKIYNMVQRLAKNADMPMPRPYIIENPQPNAFATGRNPENGAVAVTTGIVELLDERELAGVMAHELAHIKNRDTLIMTITATIAGAISMLANFAMFFGRSGNNRSNGLVILLVSILAPFAAMLVQMAISRTREYGADKIGAEICGDPQALASALVKISNGAAQIDNEEAENNPATAHMFIINPLHKRSIDGLFSTHPNTQNRVDALMELAKNYKHNNVPNIERNVPDKQVTKKGTFSDL